MAIKWLSRVPRIESIQIYDNDCGNFGEVVERYIHTYILIIIYHKFMSGNNKSRS